MILLYPRLKPAGLVFVLTVRTDTVDSHKGQVSLPGGAQEEGETIEQTALREASEELGIHLDGVQVLGPLSPLYIPVSGFRVTPIVATADRRPEIRAAPEEVVAVIETPLETIVDEKHVLEEPWDLHRHSAIVPFYLVEGYKVWGATAMILGEFGEMLRRVKVETQNGIS